MKFVGVLCDRLAHGLLTSDSLATRIRTKIKNWMLTRVNVGAVTVDRQPRRFFLSSGSALLRHTPVEAWNQFSRLEQGKFNTDLAALGEGNCALASRRAKDEAGTSSFTRSSAASCNSTNENQQARKANLLHTCRAAGPAQHQPTGRTPFPRPIGLYPFPLYPFPLPTSS